MMQDVSLAASFGRLAIVAALMVAVFLLLRRLGRKGTKKLNRPKKERALELIDRQPLGKTQSVAVFTLQDDYTLVVGVTEHRVELLTILDQAERAPVEPSRVDGEAEPVDDEVIDLARIELDADTERFLNRLRNRSAR